MSKQFPGGVISKTAPVPSGPYADSTAPGIWTLEQQAAYAKLGQWPTAGNVNPSAFIENLFQSWLYTGNGTGQSIVNGINLSANGGMVWCKARSNTESNFVGDTVRGVDKALITNSTAAEDTNPRITAFNSNGFSLNSAGNSPNVSGYTYTSWTFREQAKFFDIVTYTGNSATTQEVAHSLGSVPGCIIVKCTTTADDWFVYHRSSPSSGVLKLNNTDAANPSVAQYVFGNGTVPVAPTSTVFTVSGGGGVVNNAGETYVAYLFAHDAGGFGASGTDNVISCGSFTAGTGSINLGYEPQWIMFKGLTGANEWIMFDTMRGWPTEAPNKLLMAQSSAAEGDTYVNCQPTATGFNYSFSPDCIYIAIRRGPMKVPTLGTSVFGAVNGSSNISAPDYLWFTTSFPVDMLIQSTKTTNSGKTVWDRLRGSGITLDTTNSDVEGTGVFEFDVQNGIQVPSAYAGSNVSNEIGWALKRAPGFFDEVCYTGTGSATTFAHNLAAVPELMIIKKRNTSSPWIVYSAATGNSAILQLEDTGAVQTSVTNWNSTTPTSSVFSVGTQGSVNASGGSYVAYLFATCAGVSKVGSYTGTGTLTTINCGFTGGTRFVLIKRTDTTGAWYVWDTTRGMISGTDPSLRLNSIGAQSNADSVYTIATGFQLLASPAVDVNTSGGSYIFLAIA
jgi:hypothetical protein